MRKKKKNIYFVDRLIRETEEDENTNDDQGKLIEELANKGNNLLCYSLVYISI